jgi:putative spermidine/putrescine transport system substrate-binding protein
MRENPDMLKRRAMIAGMLGAGVLGAGCARGARAQTSDDAPLYEGERELRARAAQAGIVVSLNTGGTESGWPAQAQAFRARYPEIELVANALGSTASVERLERARARPVADTLFAFAASADDAARRGLTAAFRPHGAEALPPAFRHPEEAWHAVHAQALAFIVDRKRVDEPPQGWDELLRPAFKDGVVYLDPRTTGIGQITCLAAAQAAGGGIEDVQPGLDYLGRLHRAGNVLRVLAAPPLEAFRRGEVPVLVAFESDGLRLAAEPGMAGRVAVVIPREASLAAPFATSLVRGAPNADAGRLWLNFLMSAPSQARFAAAGLRPALPGVALPAEIAAAMPAAPQLLPLDVVKAAARKAEIDAGWLRAVAN